LVFEFIPGLLRVVLSCQIPFGLAPTTTQLPQRHLRIDAPRVHGTDGRIDLNVAA
jgi:hypothetical protein